MSFGKKKTVRINREHFALFFWITAPVITTTSVRWEEINEAGKMRTAKTLLPILYVFYSRFHNAEVQVVFVFLEMSENVLCTYTRTAVLPARFAQQFRFFFTDLLIKRPMCHFWSCGKLFALGWSLWHCCNKKKKKKSVAYNHIASTVYGFYSTDDYFNIELDSVLIVPRY